MNSSKSVARRMRFGAASAAVTFVVIFVVTQALALPFAYAVEPAQPAQSPAALAKMDVCSQALQLLIAGDEAKARETLLSAYKSQTKAKNVDGDIPYFLAALDSRAGNFAAAIRYLNQSRDLFSQQDATNGLRRILVAKRLADCRYKNDELKAALDLYQDALSQCNELKGCPEVLKEEILEALIGCQVEVKNYADAERNGLILVDATRNRLKDDPSAILNVAWSMIQLSDVYRLSGQEDKLTAFRKVLRPFLQALVEMRMNVAAQGMIPPQEVMAAQLREHYIVALRPKVPADIVWAACEFRERTLPVIGWKNATPGAPVAAIICIHGLGLENRAFFKAAEEFNKRGYIVYALDVRGFGSWSQTRGFEDIDYEQTIADISAVAQLLKAKTPGLHVFVLGESMGGAIALRAGAALGDQIDGVISSVPSAERFQAKRMALQTALHFIVDPRRNFDVGYVADLATSKQQVQMLWKNDPKARLRLTPIELTEFAVFMRRTKPQCEKLTKLPVLVAQGLGDRLVKPEGTFALFDAVASPDKTLLIAGLSEHLMFESPAPDPILMDTVDSWIKHHIKSQPAAAQKSN